MTGLSPHTTMTGGTESRSTEDVVATTLSLLKDRRDAVQAKPGSHEHVNRRVSFQRDVIRALQGSLLPADHRRVLMTRADELGMRPFEATLMIAMAQDRARHKLPPLRADPLARPATERPVVGSRTRPRSSVMRMSTAVCTGVLLASTLIVLLTL
ncbi:MAG: hypothetical protein P8I74_04245 [Phycisphaerales bacterium]|nr:hypothetical protein [Phycisphaerales bacterium]